MTNPYLTIWTKPKETFETFFSEREGNPTYGFPFVVNGISLGLFNGANTVAIFNINPTLYDKFIAYTFSIAVSIGLVYLFLGLIQPWFVQVIGQLWKGQASRNKIANVNSLSIIPYCLVLLYQLILLIQWQEPLINEGIHYLIWLLSFRILVMGVAMVQKFSYGLALLNILLSLLPFGLLRLVLNS